MTALAMILGRVIPWHLFEVPLKWLYDHAFLGNKVADEVSRAHLDLKLERDELARQLNAVPWSYVPKDMYDRAYDQG